VKNKLSEYVRLAAAGETVVVTDRGRAVAEIVPPRRESESIIERGVREGWLKPAKRPFQPLPPRRPVPGYMLELAGRSGPRSKRSLVIYIDSSVLLAGLLAEPRSPSEALWEEDLGSSQLLAYEVWNRINVYGLGITHGGRARGLLARVNLTEMGEPAWGALKPFPVAVRTLDALHLDDGISAHQRRIDRASQLR
jgi:prevent-host-death family protein